MFEKIVLASGSAGKLKEFSRLFTDLNIEALPQPQPNTFECPEPCHAFVENVLAKARHITRYSALSVFTDDSDIYANALNGTPGISSARYAGEDPKSDAANNAKLSSDLADRDDKNCYYACVLVLVYHENDPQPIITEGIWHGQWQAETTGTNGFSYDPHFYLVEHDCTVAELAPEIKNTESHRAQAPRELSRKVKSLQTKGRLKPSDDLPHIHSHAQAHT